MSDGKVTMPYSAEAEEGLVGAALIDPAAVVSRAVLAGITPESFYLPLHRTVWPVIVKLSDERGAADTLMVWSELERTGAAAKIGSISKLNELVDAVPTVANAACYIDIVRSKAICRGVIESARESAREAMRAECGDRAVSSAIERFTGLVGRREQDESNEQVMTGLIGQWRDAHDGRKPAIGIETPWESLTELMCGLENGVTVIAGRPSQGKTTIEDMIACHAARKGIPVGRITLDATRKELLGRAMCRLAGVSLPKLKFGHAGESNFARIQAAAETLAGLPMHINDRVRDIREIAAQARAWKTQEKIGLLTIDYVSQVEAADMGRSAWDTTARVSYVSGVVKSLALELRLPIVLLAQLSRVIEKEGREPRMSDLRDSGCLEQDAHKILFVYRDEQWCKDREKEEPGSTKKQRLAWCDLLKHKDGETGRIPMTHRCHYFRFDEGEDLI